MTWQHSGGVRELRCRPCLGVECAVCHARPDACNVLLPSVECAFCAITPRRSRVHAVSAPRAQSILGGGGMPGDPVALFFFGGGGVLGPTHGRRGEDARPCTRAWQGRISNRQHCGSIASGSWQQEQNEGGSPFTSLATTRTARRG